MDNQNTQPFIKRSPGSYNFAITNEDSYEEVVSFRLNKLTVYLVACTLFVLFMVLTTAIIVFTPLKNYLPGAQVGGSAQVKELRTLKIKTDSIENKLLLTQKYYDNLQRALKGKDLVQTDTTRLDVETPATQPKEKEKKQKKKPR